jgi:hypothetical protein
MHIEWNDNSFYIQNILHYRSLYTVKVFSKAYACRVEKSNNAHVVGREKHTTMHQTYLLDLDTMLSTLSRYQLSGLLYASIARGRMRKEQWQIEMTLYRGKVATCLLLINQARVTGEEALQAIQPLGAIPWKFVINITSPALSSVRTGTQSHQEPGLIPKQTVSLPATEISRLPRSHFLVYASVNGKRTVENIAQLLKATPEQVEQVLQELQSWGLVRF